MSADKYNAVMGTLVLITSCGAVWGIACLIDKCINYVSNLRYERWRRL